MPDTWIVQTGEQLIAAWRSGTPPSATDAQILLLGGILPSHLAAFDSITQTRPRKLINMKITLSRLVAAAAAIAALALVPLAAIASPAAASAGQSTLSTNQVLQAGQDIVSPNGYWAVVQTDGNFVLYTPDNRPLWASNTVGTGAHDWLAMQSDGNLVLYNSANRPVWANNRAGSGTANWLAVQTDGNLVEYTSANKPVWATNTVQGGSSSTTPAFVTQWGTAGPLYAYRVLGYPYPYASQCTNGQACQADQWNFFRGQCTSWVAYRLDQLVPGLGFTNSYRGQHWGAASNWGYAAQRLGIYNHTPARGSVAWYSSGHVAYVEQVNSPTSVVISEMNIDYKNGFRVRTITTSSGWPTGFIHIHDR